MAGKPSTSRVVPLRTRSLAETTTILAVAAGLRAPPAADRAQAGTYPVADEETQLAAALYAAIRDPQTRQALLDVLMAINHNR